MMLSTMYHFIRHFSYYGSKSVLKWTWHMYIDCKRYTYIRSIGFHNCYNNIHSLVCYETLKESFTL